MKKRCNGDFGLCYFMNLVFDLEWSIPAWLLLIMHFVLNWSIWFFVVAMGLFVIGVLVKTIFIGWAASVGKISDKPKQNLNPYSVKNEQMLHRKDDDK